MKQQNSILTSTLHCILAGLCSGFLFNIIMIFIVMLFSDRLSATTLEMNLNNDLVPPLDMDVLPRSRAY